MALVLSQASDKRFMVIRHMTACRPDPPSVLEELFPFPVYSLSGELLGTCHFTRSENYTMILWRVYHQLDLQSKGIAGRDQFEVLTQKGLLREQDIIGDLASSPDRHFVLIYRS